MSGTWPAEEYLEALTRDVLTAEHALAGAAVGHAALLLAATGSTAESDRLVGRWCALTEQPAADLLATDALRARAWAMLIEGRDTPPDWARSLTPLDLDAAEQEHRAHLVKGESGFPGELLGDSTAAMVISGVAETLDTRRPPHPLRALAAEADSLATAGDERGAVAAVGRWAERASGTARPDVALLAGSRSLVPLLRSGVLADALGLPSDWGTGCAGALVAALGERFQPDPPAANWTELIDRVLRAREARAPAPPPADPAHLERVERMLGAGLPSDYRDFLLTSDGLPSDVVFPRLLGAAELVAAPGGAVTVSDPASGYSVITLVPTGPGWRAVERDEVLGTSVHSGFRALLLEHLRLLEESR
ncbi:SMI1/KNR4 family protein [Amycolatopsis palatopharyngis]|uniref:SMI1/KNR4 family protein n=1 Tax=Amycolatopsis palatopharyngis TaxID=187982 RepID=UPI000E26F544|nr:SMI1/KNR4 family protein [Amycolatopsis palatopharyngis]